MDWKYYLEKNPQQRITFEYVMLKDVNDSDEDARNLVELIKKHQLTALLNSNYFKIVKAISKRNLIF